MCVQDEEEEVGKKEVREKERERLRKGERDLTLNNLALTLKSICMDALFFRTIIHLIQLKKC